MKSVHVAKLNGRSIVAWVATEMALSEEPVLWEHSSVPYLQLISIDVQLDDGAVYRMLSQLDDGSGYYGLYLVGRDAMDTTFGYESGSIYRTRVLSELPVGPASLVVTDIDGPNAVLAVDVTIGGHSVSCWAAEVQERDGGYFDIVAGDESILIQVDGIRPQPLSARV
jgi:hypothetical protein